MGAVGDDLIPILTRFHRDVLLPEFRQIVRDEVGSLRVEVTAHFDAIYKRFEKLETEYHMLVVGLKRVEERLDRVEGRLDRMEKGLAGLDQKVDKMALRSELEELKARVGGLQSQIRVLEERLGQ